MKQFENHLKSLISNIKYYCNNDIQKILYLHNFIQATVEYPNIKLFKILDKKFPLLNPLNNLQRNYFTVYGTLINKEAHCFGIAKTVKLILNNPEINIKCKTIVGYIKNLAKGKIIHIWNIIIIDDKTYHLDTTFDITRNLNTIKKNMSFKESLNEISGSKATKFCYERFLVGESKLKNTHLWNENKYPICRVDYPIDSIKHEINQLKNKGLKFVY
ncbi:MAG: hypothetical protein LBJ32_02950 [Oscillospiraceae bacterium]|jgi:hypothetical protein|nr:hypothetical protein [Oscillospiraceae bacterium]